MDNQSTSVEQLTAEELLKQFAEELHAQYLYDSYSGKYYQLRGEILRRMAAPQGGPSDEGWISVKERLPEPYTTHLLSVISRKGPSVEMGWRCDNSIWQSVEIHPWDEPIYYALRRWNAKQVTDWRPLPTPPVAPSPETWKASGPVQMYTDPQNPDHLSFDPFELKPSKPEQKGND